ncbi:MAG: ChbG/HpnK family deacetylase [bacterium]
MNRAASKSIVYYILVLVMESGTISGPAAQSAPAAEPDGTIRLVIRGDDMGSSHTANVACIQAFKEGIMRTVEVMVPAPWFPEAVKMLRENPGLDVGVHWTLTSEWELMKWGPLTQSPSLANRLGHFLPMTSQRPDFPPGTGFLQSPYQVEEVEAELRAQIERAKELIPNISHLTAHMGLPSAAPNLRSLASRLSQEYQLPLELPGAKPAGGFGGSDTTPGQKESALVKILENLRPGLWLFVDHPGLDTPEMQSLGHTGYWNVAADRDGVTRAFTSPKVREVIQKRAIRLMSYAEVIQERK